MIKKLTHVCIYVRDTEEALDFYTEKLGMEKKDDMTMENGGRWLTVAFPGQDLQIILHDLQIFLHDPTHWTEGDMANHFLSQVGQGTMWCLETDNIKETHETLVNRGVKFMQEPTDRMYGTEAIFEDLYGNKFLLLQPKAWS